MPAILIPARNFTTGLSSIIVVVLLLLGASCKKNNKYLQDDIAYFREHLDADMTYDDLVRVFGEPAIDLNAAMADSDGLHMYQYALLDSTFVRIGYRSRIEYACLIDSLNNIVEDIIHVNSGD